MTEYYSQELLDEASRADLIDFIRALEAELTMTHIKYHRLKQRLGMVSTDQGTFVTEHLTEDDLPGYEWEEEDQF